MNEDWDYIKIYATKSIEDNEINYFYETHFEYGPYSLGHLCSDKEEIGKSLLTMLKKSEAKSKKEIHLISDTQSLNQEDLKRIKKYLKTNIKEKLQNKFPSPKINLEEKI